MDLKIDEGLKALLESGKDKGYLTYSQVNDYLPDDAVNPEKLDQLLMILEEQGIELIDESEAEEREAGPETPGERRGRAPRLDLSFMDEEDSRRIDDPVRMYLTQMGEIPLLTRDQEIALAKKIEITRKRFRRKVLDSRLRAAQRRRDPARRSHAASSPSTARSRSSLDRDPREGQDPRQRMPVNLRDAASTCIDRNDEDFASWLDPRRSPRKRCAQLRRASSSPPQARHSCSRSCRIRTKKVRR